MGPLLLLVGAVLSASPQRIGALPPVTYAADDDANVVPDAAMVKLRELLESAIDRRLAYGAVEMEMLSRGRMDEAPPVIEAVKKKMDLAQTAYFNVDLPQAEALLDEAAAMLNDRLQELRPLDIPILLEVLAQKALVLQSRGDLEGVDRALDQLATIRPTYTLDPVTYPPALQEAFGRAVERAKQSATALLELASVPGFATVFVDGIERGKTPLIIRGLPPGDHLVRLEAPVHLPLTRRVTVGQGAERLVLTMQPDRAAREVSALLDGIRAGKGRADVLARAVAAVSALGVDALLVTAVAQAKDGYVVGAALVGSASVPPSLAWGTIDKDLLGGAALAHALVSAVVEGGTARRVGTHTSGVFTPLDFQTFLPGIGPPPKLPDFVEKPPPPPPPPTPVYKKWWFWPGLVVVAGGAAAGTYCVMNDCTGTARPEPDHINIIVRGIQ